MTTSATGLMTADELLRLGDDVHGELIRGVLHEIALAGQRHGRYAATLGTELWNFVRPRRLGTVAGTGTGVLLERDPDTVLAPDAAFTSVERMPLGEDVDGYAEVVPDLVAEVRSPSESRAAAGRKAEDWLRHGVRLVWVVHPDTRTIDVHREGGSTLTLGEGETLDGGDVLPGFACPVRAVFEA